MRELLSTGLNPGIRVAEEAGAEQAIARAPTSIAAFVGRTLRGPTDRPVTIASFTEFQQVFGGLWQPSTLSYAVEQFFENGGRTAIVVRVANGGRAATLTLPGPAGQLTLQALCPGTREFLRAAVDYDGIPETETESFNLVIQRVRSPGSEFIEDQEIFRRVSVVSGAARSIATVLLDSGLVRLAGEVPAERPERTLRTSGRALAAYANSNADGDDGGPLTDYDLIGSASEGTGLFALRDVENFNFLCLPPLTRDQPVGLGTLLVAGRYCRERRAMLIVDPPLQWDSVEAAYAGIRDWGFASENALMYFPCVLAYDRLRGRFEPFAPCGAVAGMLTRLDETVPVWSPVDADDPILRPGLRPACTVDGAERARLASHGINVLQGVRASSRQRIEPRTLAGGAGLAPEWRYLSARRLALFIVDSIERGTRWVVFEPNGPVLWRKLQRQVGDFLSGLEREGAFPGRAPGEAWFVICDERLNPPTQPAGTVSLLLAFAAMRAGEHHTYLLTHQPAATRVQHVSLNRLQSAGGRPPLDPEIDVATLLADAFRR